MIDTRLHDLESISKNKNLQTLLWAIFFIVIFVTVLLLNSEMTKISRAQTELAKLEGITITNKFGEVIQDYKAARFEVDDSGKTIDWLKYWRSEWNKRAIFIFLIFLISILLEIFIIIQIKYLHKIEMHLIFQYELDRKSKE